MEISYSRRRARQRHQLFQDVVSVRTFFEFLATIFSFSLSKIDKYSGNRLNRLMIRIFDGVSRNEK